MKVSEPRKPSGFFPQDITSGGRFRAEVSGALGRSHRRRVLRPAGRAPKKAPEGGAARKRLVRPGLDSVGDRFGWSSLLSAIVKESGDVWLLLDDAGRVTSAIGHGPGLDPTTWIGRPLADVVGTTQGTDLADLRRRVRKSGVPAQMDLKALGAAPKDATVRVRLSPLRGPLGERGTLAMVRDVTRLTLLERSEAEIQNLSDKLARRVLDLARANRELETFSYAVSHELRTPLTVIENYAHILLKGGIGSLDEPSARALRAIRSAVHRMADLIENILRLSRVTRLPVRRQRFDLAEMARSILSELREEDAGRRVTAVVPNRLWVEADPQIIQVALINLLTNAWNFTKKKRRARIEVGQTSQTRTPTYYVRDNGVGFDMKDASRLFQLFERLHPDAEYRGSGIGLATVGRAIERHDGAVWAKAVPGRGATFYFTLGPAPGPSAPTGVRAEQKGGRR